MNKYTNLILLSIISMLTTLALWLPFFLRMDSFWNIKLPQEGMATVVANYDGPYYIVAAKSLYNPEIIKNNFHFPLEPIYYSAHYPLYPLLIRAVVLLVPFIGYPYAMMLVTLVTGILAVLMFYLLLTQIGLKKQALWLAILFTVFPARWLVVRSTGSPEPLFLLTLMASVYFFSKEKWWMAGLFGALAQGTKPPGILLFVAYCISLIVSYWPKIAHTNSVSWVKQLPWRAYPILLIPLTLLGIYTFYGIQYGNFLAYFNSGDNIHLKFPPFQVFNPDEPWVGTFWLEEIIWLYLIGALGILYLIKQARTTFACFASIFFFTILFVTHRDIARYSLPLVPFILIAYAKILDTKEFKIVFLLILIPIYLFSLAFITRNVTPIGDWGPLL